MGESYPTQVVMPTPRALNTRYGIRAGEKEILTGTGILADVGDLTLLDTADKTGIVAALNEVKSDFVNITTDQVAEGLTNLYYTDARAQAAITGGTGVTVTGGVVAIGQSVATTANVTFNDTTLTGKLNGPSIFVIDPASLGDDTGEVVIRGSLTVQGTTTTVNSTTVEIVDKNILLAKTAVDGSQADGGGITVAGANATWSYSFATDSWTANKALAGTNGTAALPSYSFSADPDTGLYRSGANQVSVATNGLERLRVGDTATTLVNGVDLVLNRGTYGGTVTTTTLTDNRTYTLPNVSGTLITTGDTGTVTSTMIADGTITDTDVSATAELAVSKLANGTARQLLQTDAAGTGVEWASNIDIPGTLDVTGIATFDTKIKIGTTGGTVGQQEIAWNADEATFDVGLINGVTNQLGQEIQLLCRNDDTVPIPNGTPVRFSGTAGNSGRIFVKRMVADGSLPGYVFFGVTTQDILVGTDGYVTTFGKVRGVKTNIDEGGGVVWQDGDVLWCDPAVPGGLTKVEPQAPNLKLPIAAVVNAANNGVLMVRWDTGRRLKDLHDVEANGTTVDGDILRYNAAVGRWESSSDIGISGNLSLASSITFEGATANEFETVLSVVDPTADRSISIPNQSGNLLVSGNASIVNADVSATAAIAFSKLATLPSANILVGNSSNVATSVAVTGDVTISNTGVTAIGTGVIVNADVSATAAIAFSKLANVSATDRILGRSSAGAGPIEEIVCTAAGRALLDDVDSTAQRSTLGLVIGTDVQPYDADTAKTDVVQSFTAAQRGAVTTLTPAATVTADFALANHFTLTLNQATTLANPTNLTAGQSGTVTIVQDAVTARTLSYGNYWYFEGGIPTLGTTLGAVSTIAYYVNSATRITAKLINQPVNV